MEKRYVPPPSRDEEKLCAPSQSNQSSVVVVADRGRFFEDDASVALAVGMSLRKEETVALPRFLDQSRTAPARTPGNYKFRLGSAVDEAAAKG